MIDFPLTIFNEDIKDIFSFFTFYKNKCNDIVHLNKNVLKYYILPNNNQNAFIINKNPIFNEYEKEYAKINNNTNGSNKKEVSTVNKVEKELDVINVKYVLEFLFNSIQDYEGEDTPINNKLITIKNMKNSGIDNTINSISQSFKNIVNMFEKDNSNADFPMSNDIFTEDEINYINLAKSEFESHILSLKNIINSLKNEKSNFLERQNLINRINNGINNIVCMELRLKDNYYFNLNETKLGRLVLVYFQYKFLRFEALYEFIKEVCENYETLIEKQKSFINEQFEILIQETKEINLKLIDNTYLKSGNEIFCDWKLKFKKMWKYDDFIKKIISFLKNVSEFKLDNGIILDNITSCWLVKHGLDEYLLE